MIHQTIPALSTPLHGKVLIEASAGTGKTWTLTAIIIRLLIERGAHPKQIIATTFTRKAATELRTRIYNRVQEVAAHHKTQSALPLKQRAELDDPLVAHLFRQCADDEAWQALKGRLQNVQQALEQMFIGTLDGLCQKWLLEHRLETGADEALQHIDEADLAESMVHQQLRHYHHQIQSALPALYPQYLSQYQNQTPNEVFKQTQNALIFSRAQLHPSTLPSAPSALPIEPAPHYAERAAWLAWLETHRPKLNGNSWKDKQFEALGAWVNGAELKDGDKWLALLQAPKFKKGFDDTQNDFINHPITQSLITTLQRQKEVATCSHQIAQSALYHIAAHLRETLPKALDEHHQTTYSRSLQRLNEALEQHPHLARQISHQYPIMLVDESQDLNDEQSALLKKIYLDEQHDNPQRYFLLVGDPKQAIYQFRGGDVENYNHLKALFASNEQHKLTENHRSNQNLLAALNHHYAQLPELSAGIQYEPVRPAPNNQTPRIVARDGSQAAMFWVACHTVDDEIQKIADGVAHLLSPQSALIHADNTPITTQNILVLLRTRHQLQLLEHQLNQRHIAADFHNDSSIFESPVAQALQILWHAIWQPRHQGAQNRLLCSLFYQKTLADIRAQSALPLTEALSHAKALWLKYGVQSALYYLLEQQNIWQTLAQSQEAAQYLNDLRRLLEIIAQYGKSMTPESFIHWWEQQIQTCPTAEWAQALPTLMPNAVRLMTIHKAKGLEADVVLVGGFSPEKKPDPKTLKLYSYHLKNPAAPADNERHLSANIEGEAQERIAQAEVAENNRLIYVALTRAKQALWVFYQQSSSEAKIKTPEGLQALLGAGKHPNIHLPFEMTENARSALPPPTRPNAVAHSPEALVKPPAKTTFYGTYQTSFSNLTRHTSPEQRDDDEPSHQESALANEHAADWGYPTCFPRGNVGGHLVHDLLERIDFHNEATWNKEIQRQIRHLSSADAPTDQPPEAINEARESEIRTWLQRVTSTPLLGSGLSLRELNPAFVRKELDFQLTLNAHSRPIAALNQVFHKYGKALYLNPEDPRAFTLLKGTMDLVYQHQNQIYLLDYKTNLLPNTAAPQSALALTMQQHQYELQAALYQLALWRFIKAHRLPLTLGTPNYYFVRYGLQYPIELIDENFLNELDQCFRA